MNNSSSHRSAPTGLSGAQLDGTACVACGRDYLTGAPVETVPAGMVDGGQVFACTACIDEDGPHVVVVEHAAPGALTAVFRPGLGADARA